MQMQLSLFNSEDLTVENLLNILQLKFPKLKFSLKHGIIQQTAFKKIRMEFEKIHKTKENQEYWCRKNTFYISCFLGKNFGNYEGFGYGADTFEEWETEVNFFATKIKDFITELKDGE